MAADSEEGNLTPSFPRQYLLQRALIPMFRIGVYGEPLLDVLYREVVGFINKFILDGRSLKPFPLRLAIFLVAIHIFEGTCHADLL